MTLPHKIAAIGVLTVALGIAGLAPFALALSSDLPHTAPALSSQYGAQAAPAATDTPLITGTPVRIEVPAAHIDLAVIDGSFNQNNGEWTLTNDKAQFATPSRTPNNKEGNTLIYGHNTTRVFGALHKLPADSVAKVYTQNGHVFTYKLRGSETVKPHDTSIFDYQGAPRLTLQTCTGLWSEARKFFYFELISVE